MIHRDIKPSTVLVTNAGRVVIVSLGDLVNLSPTESQARETHHVNKPAYLAPEQIAGTGLSAASDWYAVGVMLYEALTGRLPFLGSSLEMLMNKQRFEPPAPREWVIDLPEDLNALCVEMLRRDPMARPSDREILHRLGVALDR